MLPECCRLLDARRDILRTHERGVRGERHRERHLELPDTVLRPRAPALVVARDALAPQPRLCANCAKRNSLLRPHARVEDAASAMSHATASARTPTTSRYHEPRMAWENRRRASCLWGAAGQAASRSPDWEGESAVPSKARAGDAGVLRRTNAARANARAERNEPPHASRLHVAGGTTTKAICARPGETAAARLHEQRSQTRILAKTTPLGQQQGQSKAASPAEGSWPHQAPREARMGSSLAGGGRPKQTRHRGSGGT
mmetsp:Transcript_81437/g.226849  ORF Transcript_81437/g.226849 Transcript_81437/m.226849 type:complete len:258 (-) Transcript_81437:3-776(-)